MGKQFESNIRVVACNVGDQDSTAPSGVSSQSNERISAPISPPPENNPSADEFASIGDFVNVARGMMIAGVLALQKLGCNFLDAVSEPTSLNLDQASF